MFFKRDLILWKEAVQIQKFYIWVQIQPQDFVWVKKINITHSYVLRKHIMDSYGLNIWKKGQGRIFFSLLRNQAPSELLDFNSLDQFSPNPNPPFLSISLCHNRWLRSFSGHSPTLLHSPITSHLLPGLRCDHNFSHCNRQPRTGAPVNPNDLLWKSNG